MLFKQQTISRRQLVFSSAKLGAALAMVSYPGFSVAATPASGKRNLLPADITEWNATQLSTAILQRLVSCTEVMQAYLAKIDRYNPVYNAIVAMPDQGQLLKAAQKADAALAKGEYWGWMHGMPHAVKDLSNARGLINSMGSSIFASNMSDRDDIFVERIRAQGAILIGKTNVPEFGLGSQSYNSVYGTTRNAYDPALNAGGSSGGAAVGLATGMLPVADGSDMMGSLRNPAAYNNVIGFRPSQGRVPHDGQDIFFQQLGYEGPMGRTVEDTVRLLSTMAGYDSRIPMSLRDSVLNFDAMKPAAPRTIKLGWMGDYDGYLATEPGVLDLCRQALNHISTQGVTVEDCQPEYDMARLWQTWLTFRHWTVCGLAKPLYDNPKTRALLKPEAVWEIEGGLQQTGIALSQATVARSDWYRAVHKLFERFDFLVLPTAQVFPFSAELHWAKEINGRSMDTYHRWMEVSIGGTLSGCPVINLPAGFDQNGRPMGLQVMGPMGADSQVLEFALAYEASTNYQLHKPTLNLPS